MGLLTLSQIDQRVLDSVDGNSSEYPQAERYAVINQALMRLNLLLGFSQTTVAVPGFSVAGQLLYSIPAGIPIPLSCDFEGQRLEPYSLRRLARRYQNWSVDTGLPQEWVRLGLGQFLIHPIDPLGGGLLEVSGVANITRLSAPTDTSPLDDSYAEILVNWCKCRLLLKEGGQAFASQSIVLQKMMKQVRLLSIWQDVKFPSYWILDQQSPADARGVGDGLVQ